MLGTALRHGFALADASAKIEAGTGATQAANEMYLFWKREEGVSRQLSSWNAVALDGALAELYAAVRRIRRSPLAAESVTRMAFLAHRAACPRHGAPVRCAPSAARAPVVAFMVMRLGPIGHRPEATCRTCLAARASVFLH